MNIIIVFIEFMFSMGLFINALLFIPQIITVYKAKSAGELSLVTFLGFSFIQFFIILHALLHHDRILLVGYIFSFILCAFLTGLIIYYRYLKAK